MWIIGQTPGSASQLDRHSDGRHEELLTACLEKRSRATTGCCLRLEVENDACGIALMIMSTPVPGRSQPGIRERFLAMVHCDCP